MTDHLPTALPSPNAVGLINNQYASVTIVSVTSHNEVAVALNNCGKMDLHRHVLECKQNYYRNFNEVENKN